MARSKKGEAIRAERRTPTELRQLEMLQETATKASDLATRRRATAGARQEFYHQFTNVIYGLK